MLRTVLGALALSLCVLFGPLPAFSHGPETTLLVTLHSDSARAAAEELIAQSGGRVLERLQPLPVYRVGLTPDAEAAAVLARVSERADLVRAAELEGEQVAGVAPNDNLYRAF